MMRSKTFLVSIALCIYTATTILAGYMIAASYYLGTAEDANALSEELNEKLDAEQEKKELLIELLARFMVEGVELKGRLDRCAELTRECQ